MADNNQAGPRGAVSDAATPGREATDPNGAQTAVGVPHPENRGNAFDKNVDIEALGDALPELDDYDADKAAEDIPANMPPDEDDGRSFEGLDDVGEQAGIEDVSDHAARRASDTDDYKDLPGDDIALGERASNAPGTVMEPTLDNQVNQPDRFQRRAQKAP